MGNLAALVGAVTGGLTFLAVLFSSKAHPICSKCRLLVLVVLTFYMGVTGLVTWLSTGSLLATNPTAGVLVGILVGFFVGGLALFGIEPLVSLLLKAVGLEMEDSGLGRPGAVTKYVVSQIDTGCSDHGEAIAFEVYPMRIYRRYEIKSFAALINSRFASERAGADSATKKVIDAEKRQFAKAHRSARALADQAKSLKGRARRNQELEAYKELVRAVHGVQRLHGIVESAARPTIRPRFMRPRR